MTLLRNQRCQVKRCYVTRDVGNDVDDGQNKQDEAAASQEVEPDQEPLEVLLEHVGPPGQTIFIFNAILQSLFFISSVNEESNNK